MPTFKITALFNAHTVNSRSGGWSETVYKSADNSDQALTFAVPLHSKRLLMLPESSILYGVRVQDVSTPGRSRLKKYGTKGGKGTMQQDLPKLCLNVDCVTANGSRRSYQCGGLPDEMAVGGERFQGDAAFNTALEQFRTALLAFQLRIIDPANMPVEVQSIDEAGNFILTADLVYAVGNTLQCKKMVDIFGQSITGRFKVEARTDARHGRLANWPGTPVETGKLRLYAITYTSITDTGEGNVSTRPLGRPFGAFTGRRKRPKRPRSVPAAA